MIYKIEKTDTLEYCLNDFLYISLGEIINDSIDINYICNYITDKEAKEILESFLLDMFDEYYKNGSL